MDFSQSLEVIAREPEIAVDTEGFAEDTNRWLLTSTTMGISVSLADGTGFYFPLEHIFQRSGVPAENLTHQQRQYLFEVLSKHPNQIHHNSKHDIKALDKVSVKVNNFFCTMVGTHWIDENILSKALDYVSKLFGGEGKKRPESMQAIINGLGWQYTFVDDMNIYSVQDARAAFEIKQRIWPEFVAQGYADGLWDIEQDFTRLVNDMEWTGIQVDTKLCEREVIKGEEIMTQIRESLGCNPSSPNDMADLLLDELGLPIVRRTPGGKPSFDKKAMEIYDEKLAVMGDIRAKQIVRYRGWQRAISNNYKPYLLQVGPDGRIRPNYNLHRARTPRMTCNDPNLQNIPRESNFEWNGDLKRAFIAKKGYRLIEFDYKNLEFRLAAAYGKEADLILVLDDPDRNVFMEYAVAKGMPYNPAKTLHYSIMYGAGIPRIRDVFNETEDEATKIIHTFWGSYPGISRANQLAMDNVSNRGYVSCWTGRRRRLTDRHKAFNAVIQGGAAEIVKRAALRTAQFNSSDCNLLLHIHDSLLWEIREDLVDTMVPQIKREMERVPENFGVSFFVEAHEWGKK